MLSGIVQQKTPLFSYFKGACSCTLYIQEHKKNMQTHVLIFNKIIELSRLCAFKPKFAHSVCVHLSTSIKEFSTIKNTCLLFQCLSHMKDCLAEHFQSHNCSRTKMGDYLEIFQRDLPSPPSVRQNMMHIFRIRSTFALCHGFISLSKVTSIISICIWSEICNIIFWIENYPPLEDF